MNERAPKRNGCGCIAGILVTLVVLALLVFGAYRFFLEPRLAALMNPQLETEYDVEQSMDTTPDPELGNLEEQASDTLPTAVALLPNGEIVLNEEAINANIAAHIDQLRPIESVVVHFVPDEVQIQIKVLGVSSTVRTGLTVEDGKLKMVNPKIDGSLGQFVSLEDLAKQFEEQLGSELDTQGRAITDVRIEQGQMILQIAQE